jgi:hypothetical protein
VKARVVLLVAVTAAALGPGAGGASACAKWAAGSGKDSNAGTASAPYRSVGRLIRGLAPGREGCLAGGSVFTGSFRIRKRGITLRTPSGRRAEIRGAITIDKPARGVTLAALAIRGPRDRTAPIVLVRADGARLIRNDVTGLSTEARDLVCVAIERAANVVVDGNSVHQCTRTTSRRITSVGILARGTRGGRIANNFVTNIVGDGIALYGARRMSVHHNLVDGNVSGIVLGAGAKSNRIVSNIVSRAGRNLVRSTLVPRTGRTNLVASNCLWHGFRGNVAGAVSKRGNVVASPRFVNRPVTLALRPGPCFGKRPYATASLRRAAAIAPAAVRPPVRRTPRTRPVTQPPPPGLAARRRPVDGLGVPRPLPPARTAPLGQGARPDRRAPLPLGARPGRVRAGLPCRRAAPRRLRRLGADLAVSRPHARPRYRDRGACTPPRRRRPRRADHDRGRPEGRPDRARLPAAGRPCSLRPL